MRLRWGRTWSSAPSLRGVETGGEPSGSGTPRRQAAALRSIRSWQVGPGAGGAHLVGHDPDAILAAATALLDNPDLHAHMAQVRTLFGDGRATARIVARLTRTE